MTHSVAAEATFRASLSVHAAYELAWAVTWRSLLANVLLVPIVFMLQIAFGAPHLGQQSSVFGVLFAVLEWLLAWPFVLRRALAPPAVFFKMRVSPVIAARTVVRYWPSVLFGVSADLLSVLPVIAVLLLLHSAGYRSERAAVVVIAISLVRFAVVLPVMIRALTREATRA